MGKKKAVLHDDGRCYVEYESIAEASNKTGKSASTISRYCNNKRKRTWG